MASSFLPPHKSCNTTHARNLAELEFGLTRILFDNHTAPMTNLSPSVRSGCAGIDPGLGAATTRVPAASREDSRSQAILKLHRPSSLDYRAHHGLPVESFYYWV